MKSNIMKWALPAFALTALLTGEADARRLPGTTSYGARLGYNNMSLNGKGFAEAAALNGGDALPEKKMDHNYGGATGSLFISHDVNVNRMCVGVEGYLSGSNVDTGRITHVVDTEASAFTTVKKDYTAGVRLKLGHYVKNDVMFYVSMGGEVSRFKIDHTDNTTVTSTIDTAGGLSKSKTLYAWVPGVGMKWKFHNSWCCHVDATYAMYSSFSQEASGGTTGYRYNLGIRPTVLGLTVGFSRPC